MTDDTFSDGFADDVAAIEPAPAVIAAAFVPGIFDDMPAPEYHGIEALSFSGIDKLLRSPQHYRLMRDRPNAPTPTMAFGTAVHCGILEPARFDSAIACAPAVDKRTKLGKATWQTFVEEHAGCIVLSRFDFDRARRCIDAVRAHPAASALLDGAIVERSLFWMDAKYNVPCKARLDAWTPDGVLVDLKTTADASPEEFGKSIANFGYHTQAAMYCGAAEHCLNASPQAYVFIAVESEPPHAIACYRLPGAAILSGLHSVNKALARYADVLASGVWSGYPETIETIALPRWAMRFQ